MICFMFKLKTNRKKEETVECTAGKTQLKPDILEIKK